MIEFLKTYIPMVISMLYFWVFSFILSVAFNGWAFFEDSMLIVFLLVVIIGISFIEWIYFTIQAATSKTLKDKALWIVLIYLFNMFIIPYYNFKHVIKVKKLEENMIIYISLSIFMVILGILIPLIG